MSDRSGSFEERVIAVLEALKPGEVITYGEVAEEAGSPRAARAVGNILAQSEGLPWWRVIHSDGRLVPGQDRVQAWRLRAEGVVVRDRRVGSATRGDERSATRRTLPEGSGPSRKDRP